MSKSGSSKVRYHVIFWLTYIILWSSRDLVYHSDMVSNIWLNFVFALSVAPFVYLNILILVPRFLLRKKWSLYVFCFGIVFIMMLAIRYYTCQFVFQKIGAFDAAERFSGGEGFVILASENMILMMITIALFLIQEFFIKERYAHQLEQKNVESELNLLKSQLQPHFLFNNLNTIYFLMETNPILAKEVMLQFSDVLSHQLYNAKKDYVSLKEELESLENFLKIQQVRHEDFLDLKYSFPENVGSQQIAPMILLTFVENAFKHGQKEGGYFVHVCLKIEANVLHLRVVNSMEEKQKNALGGVGLDNVRRRLALIYPDRHTLAIKVDKDNYSVDLTIQLDL